MAYQSPFRYLPHDVTIPIEPLVLQRAKKKLLAEFDLGSAGVQSTSKNDALLWLDNINENELAYHRAIYDRPAILQFLESGQVWDLHWYNALPEDDRLRAFIQGLVQQQFNTLFSNAFQADDVVRLQELSKFELPEIEKKGRYYFQGAMNQLTGRYHQLADLAKNSTTAGASALHQFAGQSFFKTLQALPPYFTAMRNEFANTLLQASEKLAADEVQAYTEASYLAARARLVAVSPDIVKLAAARYAELKSQTGNVAVRAGEPRVEKIYPERPHTKESRAYQSQNNTYTPPKRSSRRGQIIGAAIILIIIIIRLLAIILN
jgi:hypothetical protein